MLNRHREALEVAVAQSRQDVIATVALHRAAWQKTIAKRLAQRHEQAAQALDALTEATDALAGATGLQQWLETFTAAPERALWHPSRFASRVPGVTAPNGDPYGLPEVLAGLRTLIEPATAKPTPAVLRSPAAPSATPEPTPSHPNSLIKNAA